MPDVVVIGGGTMGTGIAASFLISGDRVALVEPSAERVVALPSDVRRILDDGARRGKHPREAASAAARRLAVHTSLAGVERSPEIVIEAVPERPGLKRSVLAEAEVLQPVVLASNTSGLSIDALASRLRRPDVFVGLHFFNPVPAMPLVEVVLGSETSDRTRTAALEAIGRIGKEPVVVRDSPGFASSRLGVLLGLEAIRMVEEGVAEPSAIDRAMELGYRHPVGPLRLTDLVGLDVRLDIAMHLAQSLGERFEPPGLLREMVAEGRLGRKSGQGFYAWPTD